jgi:hypothetical protein
MSLTVVAGAGTTERRLLNNPQAGEPGILEEFRQARMLEVNRERDI